MKKKLLFAIGFVVLMIIIMRWQGLSLITPMSKNGILDLEFAKTTERLKHLQLFWNTQDLYFNILLDFLFIASYTWFFIMAIRQTRWTRWQGKMVLTALSAAVLDVLENMMMLSVWHNPSPVLLSLIYYTAILKFICAGIILIYLLTYLVYMMFTRRA